MKTQPPRFAAVVMAALLAACASTSGPHPPTASPPPASTPQSPAATSEPVPRTRTLRVWLPEAFAPDASTPGGAMLLSQLKAFEAAHPGLTVDVRIKPASGPGGLLDYLRTAQAAAPRALPDLIALGGDDLARATRAGLIRPLDGLFPPPTSAEWYDYAVQLSAVEGTYVGVPFAGDAEILTYNVNYFAAPPRTWEAVLQAGGPFLFAADDPSALFTLAQYLALGGRLADENGRLHLDESPLTQVLEFYQRGADLNVIPRSPRLSSAHETWRAYRAAQAVAVVAPASTYLAERGNLTITGALPLPTRGGTPVALAEAWNWALVAADPEQQAPALELLRWLTEPQRAGEWSHAAGVLPAQTDALRAWPSDSTSALVSAVVSNARPMPSREVLDEVGPVLREAVDNVLSGRASASDAAIIAASSLADQ